MLATLHRSGGISALARQLGTAPALASVGAEALLPIVMDGLRAFARGSGEQGLLAMLDEFGDGRLAAEVMAPDQVHVEAGQALLEKLFPSDRSLDLAIDHAADASGLARDLLDRMLPMLAMLVGGYLAARAHGASGDAGNPAEQAGRIADLLRDDPPASPQPPNGDDDLS